MGHSHAQASLSQAQAPSLPHTMLTQPTSPITFPIQSVAVLPVALEKDPARHGQQTASDDRVAPAPPHSTCDNLLVLGSACEGYGATP